MTRRSMTRATTAVALIAIGAVLAACGSAKTASGPARIKLTGSASAVQGASRAGGNGVAAVASKRAANDIALGAPEASGAAPAIGRPFAPTVYEVRGTLPALEGDAQAWRLPARSKIATNQVSALAKAFGLTSPAVAVPEDEGGGWRVGTNDGSGPSLTVSADAAGSWSYFGGGDLSVSAVGCATSLPAPAAGTDDTAATPTKNVLGECPAPALPTPPVGVPSEPDAKANAIALAKTLGIDVDAADVESFGDEYARNINVYGRLGSVRNPLGLSIGYGSEGRITFASGSLVVPVKADRYPRIGTAAAVAALKAGQVGWFGGPAIETVTNDAIAAKGVATGAGVASPGSSGSAVEASGDAVQTAPTTPAPAPDGTAPELTCEAADACTIGPVPAPGSTPAPSTPAPIEVTPRVVGITGATEALLEVFGADGEIWLLPAYDLTTDDGGVVVPAISETYVEILTPSEGGDGGVPVPKGAPGVEPQPAPAAGAPSGAPTTAG